MPSQVDASQSQLHDVSVIYILMARVNDSHPRRRLLHPLELAAAPRPIPEMQMGLPQRDARYLVGEGQVVRSFSSCNSSTSASGWTLLADPVI